MTRFSSSIRLAVALTALAACGTGTSISRSWKAPGLVTPQFNKVLAVCMCSDVGMQRSVEDRLAKHIKGAVAAYTVVADEQRGNVEVVRQTVKDAGFDGAVVMQLVGTEKETTYEPGMAYAGPSYYGSMWGYWGYGYSSVYSPGYIREDQVVSFDTNVYSVSDEKLLWTSHSRSYNPDDVNRLVDDIVAATVDEMRKQGVLAG